MENSKEKTFKINTQKFGYL